MTSKFIYFWACLLVCNGATAQVLDSIKKYVSLNGCLDLYYLYQTPTPKADRLHFLYSASQNNEFDINLAYLEIQLDHPRVRARFAPAFGTVMSSVYAAEPIPLQFIQEAMAGLKILKKRPLWFDIGIAPSPYGFESVIAKDQPTYSRSLSAEETPYYQSGIKLGYDFTDKINFTVFLFNGWQVIKETNKYKSLGTQFTYKTDKLLVNWSTYTGNDVPAAQLKNSPVLLRFYNDFFAIYSLTDRLKVYGLFDIGAEFYKKNSPYSPNKSAYIWATANFITQYHFSKTFAMAIRGEHFYDPHRLAVSQDSTGKERFIVGSWSVNADFKPLPFALVRFEVRNFFANYITDKNKVQPWNLSFYGNVTVSF